MPVLLALSSHQRYTRSYRAVLFSRLAYAKPPTGNNAELTFLVTASRSSLSAISRHAIHLTHGARTQVLVSIAATHSLQVSRVSQGLPINRIVMGRLRSCRVLV